MESILQIYQRTTVPVGETELLTNCPNTAAHKNGDATPSLAVNRDGRFFCRVCGVSGGGAVALVSAIFEADGWTVERAELDLCEKFLHPIVPEQVIQAAHDELMMNALVLRDLERIRGISRVTCVRFRLGLDEEMRITVPVLGPYGLYQDMRRWNALRLPIGKKKNLPYEEGYGKASHGVWWNGLNNNSDVMICEGEPDAIRACEAGYNACTVIGGSTAFLAADFSWLRYRSVTICPHRDPAGMTAEDVIRSALGKSGVARLRIARVPSPHNDFTDWIQGTSKEEVLVAIDRTAWQTAEQTPLGTPTPLSEVTEAKLERAEVFIDGQVAAVSMQPFLIPKKYRLFCNGDAGSACVGCPNSDQGLAGSYVLNPTDEAFLEQLLGSPKATRNAMLRHAGVPYDCNIRVDVVERQAALPCTLIPGDHRFGKDSTYVSRDAVFNGHHLAPGSIGRFRGYSREDPRTHRSILVLTNKIRELDPTETVQLEKDEIDELRGIYEGKDPYERIMYVSDVLASCYTRIIGRRLLHSVLDLVFHSALMVPYGGIVEPGTLDVLVFGATSTGKGKTAEGLIRLYQRGEVISAKRCTTAGLIGGTVRHNQGFDVVPGAWPLRNGDLVVMDEAIDWNILQDLTRARRDGIAEFTHAGASQRMAALVRKIWIMNPPEGKTLASYRFGAEAIRDLARTEEDVARWDLAVGIESDVSENQILSTSEPLKEDPPISAELLRKKVAWAWSRHPQHIRWTMSARQAIQDLTPPLVRDFNLAEIGIVQKGNTHQKLRKFSVAVAACTFSTPDGDFLVVDGPHVQTAGRIIRECLEHPAVGLNEMTRIYRESGVIGNAQAVLAPIQRMEKGAADFARKIVLMGRGQRRTWEACIPQFLDPIGTVDTWLRERALREDGRDLIVSRAFADLLRGRFQNGNGTKPETSPRRRKPVRVVQPSENNQ